ncbi:TonB-dependent receptor [Marinilabiliaceae bacterium ANBcel2]|nr:TonB-dependent receptor [Marinilabiliaceae bacterium ANBcel2]
MKMYFNWSLFRRALFSKRELNLKLALTFFFVAVSFAGLQAQERTVAGVVTDQEGDPIPGASVVIEGTTTGTVTDFDGNYSLNVTGEEGEALVISFVGMETKTVEVDNRDVIDIALEDAVSALDEVVVVGFGTQRRANITGSVSTVDAEALESRPVSNVTQALQGAIPGLNVSTAGMGGELNQSMNINVRGAGTIGAGSNAAPLILIDGMEGDINTLNPQDIEDITVLKDAAASSIYGSRAPFGVILITTKGGHDGRTTVDYSSSFRWNAPMGLPTMMDSRTFAMYYNEATLNEGGGAVFSDDIIERIKQYQAGEDIDGTTPDGTRWSEYHQGGGANANTDWFNEHYKSAAFNQEHNLSISGGTENTQYRTSFGFLEQDGLARHANDGLSRYSISTRINSDINKYVDLNFTTRFVRQDYERPTHMNDLFYHNIARRWPNIPVHDPNGYYMAGSEINQLRDGGRWEDQEDKLYLQGQIVITPIEGWNIYGEGNMRIDNYHRHQSVLPAYAHDVDGNPYEIGVGWNNPGHTSVSEYNSKNNFFTNNIYSDYEFSLNDVHNFKVLGGFNSELMRYRTLAASRTNLITPNLPTINTATDDSRADEGQYQHWSTAGFFGRLNYNYDDRYMLELNTRYDGTSRFLDDQRWNLFSSASVGWNVARENFWTFDDYVHNFTVRASVGELGNQNTGNWYPFYQSMPVNVNSGSWLINGEQPTTSSAPGLVSTALGWETVRTWNMGFDMAMFSNRLNLSFDYFKRYTEDMVGPAPEMPVILGTGVPQINNADMESTGFELEATWRDNIGALNYTVRGVLSDDQQKVTRYPNETGNLNQWYDGQKFGEIWGYTTVGIAKTQEEMDQHLETVDQSSLGGNWGAGDIMYADINEDGRIDGGSNTLNDPGDRKIIGNNSPRYRFSLDFSADYLGWDFRMFWQGVGKRDFQPGGSYFWGAEGGIWQAAGFTDHMDFFRDEDSPMVQAGFADVNKDAYYPRPLMGSAKNRQTQTRYLEDASYIRLKNLQIGYTLPVDITGNFGIERARFYVAGENLLTFTSLTDIFDPETVGLAGWSDGKTYPLSKVYSIGVNLTF